MSFLGLFRREEEQDPLERVEAAIDELNAAVRALPDEHRHLRPWVRSGDRRTRTRPRVMLGFWDMDNECFVVTYGED